MIKLKTCLILIFFCLIYVSAFAQGIHSFMVSVRVENEETAQGATVKLMQDGKPIKNAITNSKGMVEFEKLPAGNYVCIISYTGYLTYTSKAIQVPGADTRLMVTLQQANVNLKEVNVVARTPMIENKQGKTVVNVDASPTNTGATVLEVLEKSPGVTVDRNGGISLQGKAGVLVMIDDKPTYLSGSDLNNLLSSMNASQVAQIELMANPSAKYDANGNAGIINIKTKKNKQKGFNGVFNTSAGYGVYPKTNNSLLLNYRVGKINTYINYSMAYVEYLTDIYGLRKYYNGDKVTATLDQPSYFAGKLLNNTLKTGIDYYVSEKTTLGLNLTGTTVDRDGRNSSRANWLNATGGIDSVIATTNSNNNDFKNVLVNANIRHTISKTQDFSADFDWLHYKIATDQNFSNQLLAANGYTDSLRGNIPTSINIITGKADYTLKGKTFDTFQLGWKSSYSKTDNLATYENYKGSAWVDDLTRSNHFLYDESIHGLYSTIEKKHKKISYQAGLRYEYTRYNGHQLGNSLQKDSAFTRKYGQFFPNGYITYQSDSTNSFTLTAGRRIDRPAFQVLNPFYFIINKYTYQTGNPNILPQFSWNFQLSHQFKELLTTTVSYSTINNYFSQIFLADRTDDILLYTQGNVGRTQVVGVSSAIVTSPAKWWSLNAQALYNYKKLSGFNGNNYTTDINQLNVNINNQFTLFKRVTAELSGFYTTRARNDVQELLYPTGQLSFGLSAPVLNKQGTIKFSARDVFYTNAMEGLTTFPKATEYFKVMRDSRVFTLSFTYRFGKSYKAAKRSNGGAADEMGRVGNG